MTGVWAVWQADIRTRPDIDDAGPLLDRAVDALRRHPNVAAAQYRHDQLRHVATFEVQLWLRVAHPALATRSAEDALYDTLPAYGFDIGNRAIVGPNVPAILRLTRWPADICWPLPP